VGLVDSLTVFKEYGLAQVNHPNRKGHEMVAKALVEWFP
jgi:hypothetical protein